MARRVLHDEYFRRAKDAGYVARSAYKLLEIQQRFGLIKQGSAVLDLGCAPGSWLQVAHEIIGPAGTLVGIDLKPVRLPPGLTCVAIEGDIERTPAQAFLENAPDGFDVVLSDMAPNTSGHGDDLVSARLCRAVLDVASSCLKTGGSLAMKILEGGEYAAVLSETRERFRAAKGLKPKATRGVSREMFIIGQGFRP